jgi:hypothetical protein
MKSSRFTDVISHHHNILFASIFGMEQNNHGGIDLVGDDSAIELKNRLDQHHRRFVIHHYQIGKFARQNPGKELFWGFIHYGLKTDVKDFPDDGDIKEWVTHRDAWFLPWDFAKGRELHKTKTGVYVYVPLDEIKSVGNYQVRERNGARLYVPRDSILESNLK